MSLRARAWIGRLSIPLMLWMTVASGAGAAPFPVSGGGFCPSAGSGISDSLAICTRAFGFNGPRWDVETGFPTGSGSEFQSDAGAQAAGSASIQSSLGTSSFTVHGEKLGLTSFGVADISARTHWDDSLVLSAPGLDGQSGTLQAAFEVRLNESFERNLGTALSAFTQVDFRVEVYTDGTGWAYQGSIGFFESQAGGLEDRTSGEAPGVFVTPDLGFVFGSAFDFDVESSVFLEASVNGGAGTAVANALVDVRWLGFGEVRDSGGQLVSDYSLASTTGTDWSEAALPEPGTTTFGGVGLVVVAAARTGRARRSADRPAGRSSPS